MKQSSLMSFVESAVNILVGLGVAMLANAIVLPWLGFDISFKQNLILGVIMTVVSLVRSYGLRRLFEALHIRRPLSPFMQAVVAERYRQIEAEGYDISHDDDHAPGDLARAGAAYAAAADTHWYDRGVPLCDAAHVSNRLWPFHEPMKLYGFRRDLVRACALILAEGERFDRQRKSSRRKSISVASEPEPRGA